MQPKERDAALLWDMREAAKETVEFMRGTTFSDFALDKKLRYAVERQLMVIGEAARRISPAFKEKHPEIPWSSMIGQRNVLAHEYGEVLVERVWRAAAERVPELLCLLEPLIPRPPQGDSG